MQKMLEDFFNNDYVFINEKNKQFYFEEIGNDGKGKSYFTCQNKALIIKVNDKQFMWCISNLKRAEGSFIVFDNNMQPKSLHLIEMKTTLKKKELRKAVEQIKGMYLISTSIISFLGLKSPTDISAYIAYSHLQLEPSLDEETIVNNKVLIGEPDPILDIWKTRKIPLHHGKTAKLVLGKRSNDGNDNFNCDFGMV